MRVDATGTLLAVNDAGLALLGADSLDLVLGTSVLSFLPDVAARAGCAAFLHDAAHGLRGSRELRLHSVSGDEHIVEAQAIAYPGASDQTPSVTVTLRDISRTHALTQSLIDASDRHAQLEHAHATERERWIADRSALDSALDRSQHLERERDEARAALSALEAALAHQREQADADVAAARDDARRARDAWSDHEAVRRQAEQRRQFVENAVARLAVEIGLVPKETGDGEHAVAGDDGEARSAW